jgi:hypothetical protein
MAKNVLNKLFLDKVIKCPYFKYSSCGRQEKKNTIRENIKREN